MRHIISTQQQSKRGRKDRRKEDQWRTTDGATALLSFVLSNFESFPFSVACPRPAHSRSRGRLDVRALPLRLHCSPRCSPAAAADYSKVGSQARPFKGFKFRQRAAQAANFSRTRAKRRQTTELQFHLKSQNHGPNFRRFSFRPK